MKNQAEPTVVVTGIGIVSPVGATREATWTALLAGQSGISPIARFDPASLETTFAGQVSDFDPVAVVGRRAARRTDRYTQLAIAATREALCQSELTITSENASRVGVLIGTAIGGL